MSSCPDSDLYSAYVDGEIPSPWKEKLAAHLTVCPSCKHREMQYRMLAEQLRRGMAPSPGIDLESSFLRLEARRRSTLGAKKLAAERFNPAWTRSSVRIPLPALAAMFLAALFLPVYFTLKSSSGTAGSTQVATILPAGTSSMTNIGQTVKSLATSVPVYSPDLLPYAKTDTILSANSQQLFTILGFASQFESATELFPDAEIIIIKLPDLTRFSNTGGKLFTTDETLHLTAGFK